MAAFNLSRWLRKTPQPVQIDADGKRVEVPKHGRNWQEVTRTIEALGATKLSALDGQGAILRSVDLSEDDDGKAQSPELSDVQCFAKLIAEAYEKGTKSYAPLLESAMSFIERQGQRLASMEREIEKLRAHGAKLQAELLAVSAAPPQSDDGGIMAGLVQGMLAGQAGPNGVVDQKGRKS